MKERPERKPDAATANHDPRRADPHYEAMRKVYLEAGWSDEEAEAKALDAVVTGYGRRAIPAPPRQPSLFPPDRKGGRR